MYLGELAERQQVFANCDKVRNRVAISPGGQCLGHKCNSAPAFLAAAARLNGLIVSIYYTAATTNEGLCDDQVGLLLWIVCISRDLMKITALGRGV